MRSARSSILPTAEDFAEWKDLPTTQAVMLLLGLWCERKKEAWSHGDFTLPDLHAAAVKNAEAIGNVTAWTRVQELTAEELLSDLQEE